MRKGSGTRRPRSEVMPLTSREKNGNCPLYEDILLASKEMALTTGKSTLLRKKCIFEAGTQPAFSFGKSHKWNQNSCGGNMKLCIRRLGFFNPTFNSVNISCWNKKNIP